MLRGCGIAISLFLRKRKDAIEKCKNELHKKQKYCVWKLLEYALARQGFDVPVVDFSFEGGKWIASGIRFSLSHSYDYVAVAISDYPIGIDIQNTSAAMSVWQSEC